MPRPAALARSLAVLLACALASSGLLRPLQSMIEDARFRLSERPPTGRTVLADIDEQSIAAIGVWPWSRSIHAQIVDRLRALGAADIAFDVDFSSRSTPESDAAFEDALKRADGSVILAALQQRMRSDGRSDVAMMASRPLARFAANAWEASVDVWPDPDARIRWFSRGEAFGATALPSLAATLGADVGSGSDPTAVATSRFMIDYGIDAARLDHVSVADLLAGRVEPGRLHDKKVIVGASAVELRDFFQVPRFGLISGPTIQAMAVESLLQGRALQPFDGPTAVVVTLFGLLAVALGGRRLPYDRFLLLCLAVSVAVEAAALWLQTASPIVAVTAPMHAGLLAFMLIAVSSEVYERRIKLQLSRRNASRLRAILDRVIADNFAGIVVVDQAGIVRAVSAAAVDILGPDLRGATGRDAAAVLAGPLATVVSDAMASARSRRSDANATREIQWQAADGSPCLLECVTKVSEVVEGGAAGAGEFAVCLTFRNVTAERAAQARLAEMACIDMLSGLANRFVYLRAIEEAQARESAGAVAVILFDLDRFKIVNDRLGHTVGDGLIRAVADRMRAILVEGDVAARLGGDEFALVVERPTQADVLAYADVLVHELGGTYQIGRFRCSIAVSVGLAFADHGSPTELMSQADAALYTAKGAGGACARSYDAALRAKVEEAKSIEHELRHALARNEIEVVYQRQVDSADERIIGVEALMRWCHPDRGYVSPAKFIPVAEQTGLIEALGAWVLHTACRDAAGWPVPIKVSVNLSAVQLARADLASTVLTALREAGLPAGQLDLELTESLMMESDGPGRATLARLRSAGLKISLDDFGTGYSSLSYLKNLPIDKVKIDQSFVRDLGLDSASTAIIRAIVGLARDLGLRVNAEGVETVEQMQIMRRLGCDEVQGYLHGRAEPAEAIRASLLAQGSGARTALRAAS